jgi:hypothetical protein
MNTILALLKMALALGFTVSIEPVSSMDNAVKYYNAELNIVYPCQMHETEVGVISACQTGPKTGVIYVLM